MGGRFDHLVTETNMDLLSLKAGVLMTMEGGVTGSMAVKISQRSILLPQEYQN